MTKTEAVLQLAKAQGVVRPADLRETSLPPRLLRRLAERGDVERVGRGLYRHPEAPLTEHHSLALVGKRYPGATVCLLSALQFHELTTQLPREVWVAIGPGDWAPTASPVRLRLTRMSGRTREEGAEEHMLEGVPVRACSGRRRRWPTASGSEAKSGSAWPWRRSAITVARGSVRWTRSGARRGCVASRA